MILQNATRNMNQILHRIENYFFENEKHYNHEILSERWSLYSEIFNQLTTTQKTTYLHELEYRTVMEGESINRVMLDIINSDDELHLLFYPFSGTLEEYADLDDVKMFY